MGFLIPFYLSFINSDSLEAVLTVGLAKLGKRVHCSCCLKTKVLLTLLALTKCVILEFCRQRTVYVCSVKRLNVNNHLADCKN